MHNFVYDLHAAAARSSCTERLRAYQIGLLKSAELEDLRTAAKKKTLAC
jgi:hypothetical protein